MFCLSIVQLMYPSVWDAVKALGLKFNQEPVEYIPVIGKR
jgi:hypothetical protein